jgi:hypothetical protein
MSWRYSGLGPGAMPARNPPGIQLSTVTGRVRHGATRA